MELLQAIKEGKEIDLTSGLGQIIQMSRWSFKNLQSIATFHVKI